jgi:Protein of unknown function (DUF3435)
MAIADKALYGIESLEDLLKMEIPAGQDELELFFKDTVLDLPILRRCTKEKGTTEEIMPKSAFLRIFRAMMRKTGYFCGTSIHAVRRYVGKKIDGKSRSSIQPLVSVPFFLKTRQHSPADWLTFLSREVYSGAAFSAFNPSRPSRLRPKLCR